MYFDIYVGVDGTGPDSNAEYATAFRNSYVNQLRNKSFGVSEYERGPTLTGSETGRLASGPPGGPSIITAPTRSAARTRRASSWRATAVAGRR